MAIIVDGNLVAAKILERIKKEVVRLKVKPYLAVVLVGRDPASETYIRKKQEAADLVGIKFSLYRFSETIEQKNLIAEIKDIQQQPLSGIIIQMPLPPHLDKRVVLNVLDPHLDVDFLTWESLGKLVIGENILLPPAPGAVFEILKFYKVSILGKHVVMVGQGDLIGKPLTNLLLHQPVTFTVCNKDTKNLAELTNQADILITGAGKYNLIRDFMVKEGVVVIDAGVSFYQKKMYGDVNFAEVVVKASLITPTPGGVGPITVAKLLENTVAIAKVKSKR